MWPVKLGSNLTRLEILKLEIPAFTSRRKNASRPLATLTHPLLDSYPSSWQSNSMRRFATVPSTKQMHMVASARAMKGTILKVIMIPRPGFGCVIMLQSKPAPTRSIYQLTLSSMLECNCLAFKDMTSKFGRKQNSLLHCKHLYFIFV